MARYSHTGDWKDDVSGVIADFHTGYGEFEATIHIETLEVLEGKLPQRASSLALEGAMAHKEELLFRWQRCRDKVAPAKVEPIPQSEATMHSDVVDQTGSGLLAFPPH